jgi:hypothetical protein
LFKSSKKKTLLTPISSSNSSNQEQMDKAKIDNMKSLINQGDAIVNLKCLVLQDNEPMHMLQAF